MLATACRDRREARLFWAFLGGRIAVPWCAKGHEETRGKDRLGAGPGVKEREGGRGVSACATGGVEGGEGPARCRRVWATGECTTGHGGG